MKNERNDMNEIEGDAGGESVAIGNDWASLYVLKCTCETGSSRSGTLTNGERPDLHVREHSRTLRISNVRMSEGPVARYGGPTTQAAYDGVVRRLGGSEARRSGGVRMV